ncbi:hypothetical protein ACQ4PT_042495 [Festuca glaucescens]
MAGLVGGKASDVGVAADLTQGGAGSSRPAQSEKGRDAATAAMSGGATGGSSSGERVEQMMARLRLTAAEAKAVVIDDADDPGLVDPDRAFVGKVLAPNVLHINTISTAMRPAWGNPRGLLLNPAGDNLFIAEFGSMADRDRVMEGSPWMVGKHAVLMKKYDVEVQPDQVVFDRLAIWARIISLPNRLMTADRGMVIAAPIGVVKCVESDALGRCWGGYMRLRVEVKVDEPLMRAVTVFSSRLQTAESFAVQYERLPIYCFSCGLLGHSTLACPNPADRDEFGELPYSAKRLSADDPSRKSGGSKSGNNAAASTAQSGTAQQGARGGKNSAPTPVGDRPGEAEISSPMKGGRGAGRGRGRSGRGRGRGRSDEAGAGQATGRANPSAAGKKRKPTKSQAAALLIEESPNSFGPLALVPVTGGADAVAEEDVLSSDSNKKQKTSPSRSADPAAAAEQPRPTQ